MKHVAISALDREHRVLLLAMQVGGNKQAIAKMLGWSVTQVEYRQTQLYHFFGCVSRSQQIINKAMESGVLD